MERKKTSEDRLVVAAGFICLVVAGGIGWYVFPVYLTTIHEEMGWSMTQLTFAVAIWALTGAAFSPLAGAWIDGYGARRVMAIGTICQIIATFLIARMTSPLHMYLLFILSSFANAANTFIPISTVVSQRFDEKRGAAMGIALLGTGCGGILVPMLADVFLERYGWRGGYSIFTFFLIPLLVPIALWIPGKDERNRASVDGPGGIASGTAEESSSDAETPEPGGFTAAESMRTRSFWTLGFGDFLIGIIFTTVVVNMVAFTTSTGIPQRSATIAFGAFLALTAVGTLFFGAAADRVKLRLMMIFSYGAPAIAMTFLFMLPSPWFLYLFVILFGMTGGGRNALWPLSLGRCFGVAHLGSILGWLNIPFMLGNAIGPVLGGYIYDTTGSYERLFVFCILFSLVSTLFISRMRVEWGAADSSQAGG